ncbi:TPA: hypothetical protein ACH3X1_013774 [Trebouxia sp. C0004]
MHMCHSLLSAKLGYPSIDSDRKVNRLTELGSSCNSHAGMRYRDGALIRKCARGEANKVVAAAAQAARATAPRQQQAQEPHATVAMDPLALLHQHGISLDQLSDPSSVVLKQPRLSLLILIT